MTDLFTFLAGLIFAFTPTFGGPGISQLDQWTSTSSPSSAITQQTYGKAVRITGLANCDTIDTDANGKLQCGTDASGGGTGSAFAYLFPNNATTTAIAFNGGLSATYASTTMVSATTASSTNLFVSGIPAALLKTVNGLVTAAIPGTDYLVSTFAYLFPGNATTTHLTFSGGLTTNYASTTMVSATTASSTNLIVSGLNAASCDVKASTAGVLSCGTDATGGGGITGSTGQVAYFSGTDTAIGTSSITFANKVITIAPGSNPDDYISIDNLGGGVALTSNGSTYFDIQSRPGQAYFELTDGSYPQKTFHLDVNSPSFINGSNFGIGSTTPGTTLGVNGDSVLAGMVTGRLFTATSTVSASRFPYASTTALSGSALCIGSDCRTAWPTGGSSFSYLFPGDATTTALRFTNGLLSAASTTFSGTVFETALSEGLQYIGSLGRHNTVATSTLTASSPLTGSFTQIGSGGALGIQAASNTQDGYLTASDFKLIRTATTTFSSPLVYTQGTNAVTCPTCNVSSASVTSIATTFPISGGTITTSGTLTWAGLSTTSNAVAGNLLSYSNNSTGISNVATSSFTNGTAISVTGNGYAVGSSPTIAFSAPTTAGLSIPYASTTMVSATTASTTNLIVSGLNAASCDVKASPAGVLSCGTDATGGGGTPGGSDTQIQFNNTGAFAGDPLLTFDGASMFVGDQAAYKLRVGNNNIRAVGDTTDQQAGMTFQNNNFYFDYNIVPQPTDNGGNLTFEANRGGATSGHAGGVSFIGGDAQGGDSNGGSLTYKVGTKTGSGVNGRFVYTPKGGTTVNGILDFDSLTTSDKIFTFPDLSGTLCLFNVNCAATTTANTWSALQTINYASTTAITATTASTTNLVVSGMNAASCDVKATTAGIFFCGTDATGGGGGTFAWTPTTNFNALTNATNTPLWMQDGLQASSTSHFANASTSIATITKLFTPGIWNTDNSLSVDASGRALYSSNGIGTVGWNDMQLVTTGGTTVADWGIQALKDTSGVASADWNLRTLLDAGAAAAIGWTTGNALTFNQYDCTANTNGGKLTVDGSGVISCADDISGGGGGDYSFTPSTFSIVDTSATSSPIEVTNASLGFVASSTSWLDNLQIINSTTTNATSTTFAFGSVDNFTTMSSGFSGASPRSYIRAQNATTSTGAGGQLWITGGHGGATSGAGGYVNITAGQANGGNSNGGDVFLSGTTGTGSGRGGVVELDGGNNTTGSGRGGEIWINGGVGVGGGGDIEFAAGSGSVSSAGGNVILMPGPGAGGASSGTVRFFKDFTSSFGLLFDLEKIASSNKTVRWNNWSGDVAVATSSLMSNAFNATSTEIASFFPYATTTALSTSALWVNNLSEGSAFIGTGGKIGSVATGTITNAGNLTFSSAIRSVIGGALTIAVDLASNFAWTGAHDFGAATSLEIPNGTNPSATGAGLIAHDTTDNQLIVNGKVVLTQSIPIWSVTIASTSPAFISAGTFPIPTKIEGYTITRIQCHVVGGTSKIIAVEDASANSSEDITCATTNTTDDGTLTNATYTASELSFIDFGATSGAVNYVSISVFGEWTRE